MDTSAEAPSAPVEAAAALYNSSRPRQESFVSSDDPSMVIVDSTDYTSQLNRQSHIAIMQQTNTPKDKIDNNGNDSEEYYLNETDHTNNPNLTEDTLNQTRTKTSQDKSSELNEDTFYPTLQNCATGLSATAPPFPPVNYDMTVAAESQDIDGNYLSESGFFRAQPDLSRSPTPISQISQVAAEVSNTAAMLDTTPVEVPVTPEILSTIDDMSGAHAGSPIVELVEESFLPSLSETSKTAAEVADTAAMLDYTPADHYVIGLSAYTAGQVPEQVQIGAIRMVPATGTDDFLALIVEDVIVEGGESLKYNCTTQAKSTKLGTQSTSVPGEDQIISTKDTRPQKAPLSFTPPHLRKKSDPIPPQNDISDSESSNMSAMSNLSTDKVDKDLSVENFINSICMEDLVILASDMYARTWDAPTREIKCFVNPNPKRGSKNLFYAVKLSERGKAQEHKWVIRIPLLGRYFSSTQKSWLESDIRAMKFIKKRTDIPIPSIYGYDFGTRNRIGTPYIFLEFMEGDRVEDVWEDWDDEKRMQCLSQCAESMRMLGGFKFDKIGVLGCGPIKEVYAVHSIPSDVKGTTINGPYPSIKSYLNNIWRMKVAELSGSPTPEATKAKQFLFLLKLLVPALIDLEPTAHHFSLSFPEFGGRNVLVDCDGNVTAFTGWDKVMIVPKEMGYARYPEWIIKDWVPSQEKSPIDDKNLGGGSETIKPKTIPKIDRKSLTDAPLNSETEIETVKDSEGIFRGYLLKEIEDPLEKTGVKTLALPSLSIRPENRQNEGQMQVSQPGLVSKDNLIIASDAFSQALPLGPAPIDCQLHESLTPAESGEGTKKQKGRKDRKKNGRWNNKKPRQRHYDYDESVELQRELTDADKTKIQAVSIWNLLPEKINKDETEEKEERKKAWMAKKEEEKIAAARMARTLPQVVETFKKVVVKQNLERKLLGVVKTERKQLQSETNDSEDIKITTLPQMPRRDDLAKYRKIYHECFMKIAPNDGLANKFSHISTAVHMAITNDILRPFIAPKLARHVFGEAVGPSLLGMVGSGQWAKELLTKVNEGNDEPRKYMNSMDENQGSELKNHTEDRGVWGRLIVRPALVIGTTVGILSASVGVFRKL